MNIAGHDIGICSWSLKPKSTAELIDQMKQVGLEHVQLAYGPLLELDEAKQRDEVQRIRDAGITITAGMIGFPGEDYSSIPMIRKTGGLLPDDDWPNRKARALRAAELSEQLGLGQFSTHIGFVPPSSHEAYQVMRARVNEIAEALAAKNLDLLLETGQETASELLQFLNDLGSRNVYVNFDPGNMILYGSGDPIEAIHTLGRHLRHVHIKDAIASDQPGTKWGKEVPFGQGEVDVPAFLAALKEVGYTGPLVIEREAGQNRLEDVGAAVETLRNAAAQG